uniref:EF-hand domain-containing protein n=1 Tax=Alexandrium catenella TaxID=2925 RepID=A0A7S1QNK5_ALECA
MKDALARRQQKRPVFDTVFHQLNADFQEDLDRRKGHIANSFKFNTAIIVLILLNALVTGLEVDQYRGDSLEDRLIFFVADFGFFLIFFGEMLARLNQLGWDYFTDAWNVFDYSIIVLNCADLVITVNSQGSAGLKLASTLRCLRLLRVVRVIRGVKIFHNLWIIIQGILDSLRTVVWVGILLLIVTYCMAVALTTLLIGDRSAREHWRYCEQYVGTPWRSMWTVFQVITLDRWADIARPLGQVSPFALILLILTIIICTFGITNLILAVMVERVHTIMEESSAVQTKVLERTEFDVLKSMGEDFQLAELNADGELDFDEFQKILRSPAVVLKLRLLGMQYDEAESIFRIMDADKSGSVSPEEFVMGLQKLRGDARGQDLVALICCAQRQASRAVGLVERIKVLNAKADVIQERLDRIGSKMTGEILGRRVTAERNTQVWEMAKDRQDVIGTMDKCRQIDFPTLKEEKARYGILY